MATMYNMPQSMSNSIRPSSLLYQTNYLSPKYNNSVQLEEGINSMQSIIYDGSELSNENFLAPSEYLIYLKNLQPFADAEGSTHIAKKIRDYISDDKVWYDLLLETDSDGDIIVNQNPITVSADRVVSDRPFNDIQPRQMYHFAPLIFSSDIQYPIQARGFVIKNNINRPLESTSRSGLGSGIYGRYLQNPDIIPSLLTEANQSVYLIDCQNAYPIQDKEHGESLTIASLNTNRYMDRIIQALRGLQNLTLDNNESPNDMNGYNTALGLIRMNENKTLLRLWNIVLYRTQDQISKEWLDDILAKYAIKYLTDTTLVDSVNGDSLQELPINDIMLALGYDGIIASDPYNNGWNRGCVSYNYSLAGVIQGETARY